MALNQLLRHLEAGIFASDKGVFNTVAGKHLGWGTTDPTTQGWAPGAIINSNGTPKYNSGTKTTAVWTALAAAGVTLQTAFAAGSSVTGAAAATPMYVGDGTDTLNFYATSGSNMAFIATNTGTDLTIAPAGGDVIVTGTLAVSSTVTSTGDFTVGASKLVVTAATGATAIAAGLNVAGAIGFGTSYNKFTVAAATGNTAIAGDLAVTGSITGTFAGTWSSSAWVANPTITLSATTGEGLTITGETVTSGDILYLTSDASLSGGYYLRCRQTAAGTDRFTVGPDGSLVIAGTAATAVFTINAGDALISAGGLDILGAAVSTDLLDITRSDTATGGVGIHLDMGDAAVGGNAITVAFGTGAATGHGIAMSWGGAGTGDALNIDMTNNVAGGALVLTGAGTRTDNLIEITDVPKVNACTLYLGVTPTGGDAAAYPVHIQTAGTGVAPCIYIAHTGAYATADNGVIHLAMGLAVASTGLEIVGAGTRVRPLIHLTDTGDDGGGAIKIKTTQSHVNGYGIQVTEFGSVANNMVELLASGNNFIGDAINITLAAANVAAQAIVLTGKAAFTSPLISATTAGGAAGDTIYIESTAGNATARAINILEKGSSTNENIKIAYSTGSFAGDAVSITMNGAAAGSQALLITSNVAHTGNMIDIISTGWVGAQGKGIVSIASSTSTFLHAESSCLLITNSATGATGGLGASLRIIDTNATANNYAVYISAATCEALNVAVGKSTFAETVTFSDIAGVDSAFNITGLEAASGGTVVIAGGAGSGGAGGLISVTGGAGTGAAGGRADLVGGAGNGAFAGGAAYVTGGTGGAGGAGGAVTITGGAPASGTADGGAITITSGANGATAGNVGVVTIDCGAVAAGGTGAAITIGGTNATGLVLGHSSTTATIAANSRLTTTDGVASGTVRVIGGRASELVADFTSIAGTAEAVLGAYTIPANTLKEGSVVRVKFGVYVTNSNAGDTLIVRLRIGPTTLIGTAIFTSATTDAVNANILYGDFTIVCREAPSNDSSCIAYGLATYTQAASGTAAPTAYRLTATDLKTNGALLLEVTSTWSDEQATNDATIEFLDVEIV